MRHKGLTPLIGLWQVSMQKDNDARDRLDSSLRADILSQVLASPLAQAVPLLTTVTGNTVGSFHYALTTVRSQGCSNRVSRPENIQSTCHFDSSAPQFGPEGAS
jgi:hypothetical protein